MDQVRRQAILLVEDEPIIALGEKLMLERYGYAVTTTTTGESAVEIIRDGVAIDMVLMDIDLGSGMPGTDAAQIILAERDLPLVFLSSHTERDIVERTEGITSYGYIVKNSGEAVLLAAIRMAFRLFESRRVIDDTFTNSINGLCVHRFIHDDSGTPVDCEYVRVNAAFETQSGLSAEAITGRTIRDTYPRGEADGVIRLYAEILSGRSESRQELYFAPSDSWFELSVFRIRDDEFAVVTNNITERKRTAERVAAHQRRLDEVNRIGMLASQEADLDRVLGLILEQTMRVLNATAGMIFIHDPATDTLRWGASFGLSAEFVESYRDTPIVMGEGLTGAIAATREPIFIASGSSDDPRIARPVVHAERLNSFIGVPILASDRVVGVMNVLTRPPHELSADDVPFCAAVGAQVGWAIVTARVNAEQARADARTRNATQRLQETLARITTIVSAVPVAILVFDKNLRIIDDNPAARRMFCPDIPADAARRCGDYLRCRHCLEHQEGCGDTPLCCDCELDASITHVLSGGESVPEQDKEVERVAGGSLWIRFAVVPLSLHGEPCALLVAQDITARKRAESDMARQLAEKESLLKEIHHRVKNNIGAIASMLSLQADSAVGSETRSALEDAASRVRSMSALYQNLLLGEEYQHVSMRDYAEGVIASIARVYPHNGRIAVDTRVADFTIDAKRAVSVGIILNELVTNAFKYAFDGRDDGSLSIAIDDSDATVAVTVRDDGVGIDTGADNDGPTGFGLSLVRMLAEQLDGSFTVRNERGTTNLVRFPL